MNETDSILNLIKRLWTHISVRRRWQFALLLVLMFSSTVAEIFSIGAILPFLSVLTSPEIIFNHEFVKPILRFTNITEIRELVLATTVIFCLATLLAAKMRLLMLWANTKLSFATGSDLSINIYRRTLYQPYTVHCSRNSSEVINGISNKANSVIGILNSIVTLISSTILMIAIVLTLLAVEPFVSVSAFIGFGSIYLIIIFATKKRLMLNGIATARESSRVIKALQEGLGGIRDVLLDGSQETYCKYYRSADLPLRRAQANNMFIGNSPRLAVEALGMILMAVLAYFISLRVDGLAHAIPTLGALALGAQRFLPVLQSAFAAWSGAKGSQASLHDAIELLDQPFPSYYQKDIKPISFKNTIRLNNVGFTYPNSEVVVLKNINLEIKKGERIGFIGITGSGKSTILDLIMGLLVPTSGTITVDEQVISEDNQREWQKNISHVPQIIFLSDSSIAENIAFGKELDEIDFEEVKVAAKKAQISESIESWEKSYNTVVGERGIRLSGGQRQRIGIARAMYKNSEVLVFDEATSALDSETEKLVMQEIEELNEDLTIITVAHRLSTLKNCDKIVEIKDGQIFQIGTYQDIIKNYSQNEA